MSYDLFFRVRNTNSVPDVDALAAYFRSRKHYEVSGQQAVYQNESTGVYFIFDLGDAGDEEQPGLAPLSFNLNYVRPHIFGLEAEPELKALVQHFDLLVSDPQTDGMGDGDYSTDGFFSGWNKGNKFGYHAILQQRKNDAGATLPASTLENCWRWSYAVDDLQARLGDDVFVPRFMFVRRPDGIATAVVWPDAIPIALPEADLVIIGRKSILPKRFFLSREDMAIVEWKDIASLVQSFPVETGALPYHLLAYTEAPADLVTHIRSFPAMREKPEIIAVDQILNAELVAELCGR